MKLPCTYNLSDFNYHLPPELIAQAPLPARDASRLLVVDRKKGAWEHRSFRDLPDYLVAGDALVLNDTKVIPARFWAQSERGVLIEVLLLRVENGSGLPLNAPAGEALLRPAKRVKTGENLHAGNIKISVVSKETSGKVRLKFPAGMNVNLFLQKQGVAPLPPYIKRPKGIPPSIRSADLARYQTVYAREAGAVAAPTAGLHFTPELLQALINKGVEIVYITLHVGWGTFKPVKVEQIAEHKMEPEFFSINEDTASIINKAKQEGRKIVAVGTTAVRALETAAPRIVGAYCNTPLPQGQTGESTLFIYPPYNFKVVDALVTNFHLPQSTLLMLVSTFAGRDLIMRAYEEAIRERYRFYSYGDGMLIL